MPLRPPLVLAARRRMTNQDQRGRIGRADRELIEHGEVMGVAQPLPGLR